MFKIFQLNFYFFCDFHHIFIFRKVKVDSLPSSYRRGFFWGHGYYGGLVINNDNHVKNYTEGKLAIDVYDVKSHQPVWHGWAVKRIKSSEQDNPSKAIKTVVEQVVAQF